MLFRSGPFLGGENNGATGHRPVRTDPMGPRTTGDVQLATGASGLANRVQHAAQAIDHALEAAHDLVPTAQGDTTRWLEGVVQALERARLDCTEALFCAREARDASPSPNAIQPRLL